MSTQRSEQDRPTSWWEQARVRNEAAVQASVDRVMRETRFDMVRGRGARRTLVVALAVVLVAVGPTFVLLGGVAGVLTVLVGISLLVVLRRATRIVADAPPELLDERQRTEQARAYLSAYRLVASLFALAAIAAFFVVELSGGSVAITLDSDLATGVFMTVTGLLLAAPTCVYAWEADRT